MNELQGRVLFLIRDTIGPSCRKLTLLSVIHAEDVFLGKGTGYRKASDPR